MAKTFTKIVKEITICAKEGGIDPKSNLKLRALIQNAKNANMPKENIERALKKAGDLDSIGYMKILYEGYAPHGIALLIEATTNNKNRTVASLRSVMTLWQPPKIVAALWSSLKLQDFSPVGHDMCK